MIDGRRVLCLCAVVGHREDCEFYIPDPIRVCKFGDYLKTSDAGALKDIALCVNATWRCLKEKE